MWVRICEGNTGWLTKHWFLTCSSARQHWESHRGDTRSPITAGKSAAQDWGVDTWCTTSLKQALALVLSSFSILSDGVEATGRFFHLLFSTSFLPPCLSCNSASHSSSIGTSNCGSPAKHVKEDGENSAPWQEAECCQSLTTSRWTWPQREEGPYRTQPTPAIWAHRLQGPSFSFLKSHPWPPLLTGVGGYLLASSPIFKPLIQENRYD